MAQKLTIGGKEVIVHVAERDYGFQLALTFEMPEDDYRIGVSVAAELLEKRDFGRGHFELVWKSEEPLPSNDWDNAGGREL